MTNGNPALGGAPADIILANGRIATQNDKRSFVDALAIKDGRMFVLQPRVALGRRAVARGCNAHAARAGTAHAAQSLGARSRRMVGVSIRGKAHADAR